MRKNLLCGIIFSSCFIQANFVDAKTASLVYKNQYGSILKLNLNGNNQLSGSLTTNIASKNCKFVIGSNRPVQGKIVGDIVSLTITYPRCKSIVSFNGHFMHGHKEISLISIVNHQAKEGLDAKMIGYDIFKRST